MWRLAIHASMALASSIAIAEPVAGTKGTVTAWDEAGVNVIETESCAREQRTWDYAGCGARLRERVKEKLCTTQGLGMHRFRYQVGDSKKNPSTVSCKK